MKPRNQIKKTQILKFKIPTSRAKSECRCFSVQQDVLNVKDVQKRVKDVSESGTEDYQI